MVTVYDILQLDVMRSATILAGENGLNRLVGRVGFSDIPLESTSHSPFLTEGDLLIRSFYPTIKTTDHEQEIVDTISLYISSNCAACIIFQQFLPVFPQRALALANAHNFPVIALNEVISYALLIQKISNKILLSQQRQYQESVVLRLIYESVPSNEAATLYRQLTNSYSEHFMVLCLTSQGAAFPDVRSHQALQNYVGATIVHCSHSEFMFLPCKDTGPDAPYLKRLDYLLSSLGEGCHAGVSHICTPETIANGLRQSLHANCIAKTLEKPLFHYDNASPFVLLLSLIDSEKHKEVEEFCKEVLAPLRQYEQEEKLDLIQTVTTYINCDGNTGQVSKQLYLHENTVRSRINKAKSLLGFRDNHYAFIQRVSLALEAERLMENLPHL